MTMVYEIESKHCKITVFIKLCERTEEKISMMMNDVQQDLVGGQVAKITTYSTNSAHKLCNQHLLSRGDERNLGNIPPVFSIFFLIRTFPSIRIKFYKNHRALDF